MTREEIRRERQELNKQLRTVQQEMEQVAGGRRSGVTTDAGSYLGGGKLFYIRRKGNLVDEGEDSIFSS